jgi:hypothetical protein
MAAEAARRGVQSGPAQFSWQPKLLVAKHDIQNLQFSLLDANNPNVNNLEIKITQNRPKGDFPRQRCLS